MRRRGLSGDETMGAIESVYEDLEADIPLEEFRAAVEAKVEQMAGLADEETAAMLIAHELQDDRVAAIADIEPGMEEVKFIAKVRRIGELRTFERDGGEDGHVINIEVVDETGSLRVAFWDEQANAVEDDLEPGTVLRIKGRPKEGIHGTEVSVHQAEVDENAAVDVDLTDHQAIADLGLGQDDVTLRGRVLSVDAVRTFDRDDGSEGRVANLVLGDETGRVRITLWDEQADLVETIEPSSSVELIGGYVRDRDGTIECHLGSRGAIDTLEETIEFVPDATAICDVVEGDIVDLAGVVRSTDPVRTFDRDDGSTGQVRNVRIQDQTGDIRVALWGEKADVELAPGDTVWFGEVEIQDGWQDAVEASANWRSIVLPMELSANYATQPEADTDESTPLAAFEETTAGDQPAEAIEFTGTVVQTGSPVIVDDGVDAYHVETDTDVTLGQDVTVVGQRQGDRIDAEQVRPVEGNR